MKDRAAVISSVVAVVVSPMLFAVPANAQPTSTTGFENGTVNSPYTLTDWAAQGFHASTGSGLDERTTVLAGTAHSGSKALQINFPAGKYGDPTVTGAHASFQIPAQRTYWVSQWLRFDPNFSWGGAKQGGKVGLGLVGGAGCSGGQTCTGTNGFSVRPIWRKNGNAALYVYDMDKPGQYGEELPFAIASTIINFPRGQWFNIVQRVTVNTVTDGRANADGEVQAWYNGRTAVYKTGLRFVTNSDRVDTAVLSTFPGGNDAAYAPTHDSQLWLDDIKVSDYSPDICEINNHC